MAEEDTASADAWATAMYVAGRRGHDNSEANNLAVFLSPDGSSSNQAIGVDP